MSEKKYFLKHIEYLLMFLRELIRKYPEDPLIMEFQKWEARLIQWIKAKQIQKEIKLVEI